MVAHPTHVIVVDDHALIREGIARLLEQMDEDIEVVQAASCEEALERIEAMPELSLVLMDLQLPGMPGEQGLALLRERRPELPVVIVSSQSDRDTVLRTIRAGAMGFIPKTHSSTLMQGALQFVLQHHGTYLPPDAFLHDADWPSAALTRSAIATAASEPQPRTRPQDLGITPRQADVLRGVLQGKSNRLIGQALELSEATVKAHLTAVLRALNVTTRTEAVVVASRLGLVFDHEP